MAVQTLSSFGNHRPITAGNMDVFQRDVLLRASNFNFRPGSMLTRPDDYLARLNRFWHAAEIKVICTVESYKGLPDGKYGTLRINAENAGHDIAMEVFAAKAFPVDWKTWDGYDSNFYPEFRGITPLYRPFVHPSGLYLSSEGNLTALLGSQSDYIDISILKKLGNPLLRFYEMGRLTLCQV